MSKVGHSISFTNLYVLSECVYSETVAHPKNKDTFFIPVMVYYVIKTSGNMGLNIGGGGRGGKINFPIASSFFLWQKIFDSLLSEMPICSFNKHILVLKCTPLKSHINGSF